MRNLRHCLTEWFCSPRSSSHQEDDGKAQAQRPDGSGYFRDASAALGHTRLAIIDVTGGAQPLCNEDKSLWITFNGEIFNYVELGAELRTLGHRFRTKSDTEVVLHAFEQWGSRCFERFNGQWSLAVWDRRNRRLMLCRDRMGVRPLYYAFSGYKFLFASEIKAIFADNLLPRRFNPAGLSEIFTFWCPIAPRTAFDGISELEPGHCAILNDGKLESRPYWTIFFPPSGSEKSQSLEENGEQLRSCLINAARLRFLRSDVPVGAYLSGGIDSSVTASIIARYTHAPLKTFSLRFTDSEFDEGPYQKEMMERLGTNHQTVIVSASDIANVFPDVVWHAEQPILRTAPAPLFLLSRLVRQTGYKVIVTGEGSDEVLAGYDIFRENKVRLFWSHDLHSDKRSHIVSLLYPWMERSPGDAPSFARAFFGRNLDPSDPALSHRPRWDSTENIKSLLTADLRARMEEKSVSDELIRRMPAAHADWDPLGRAQWLEMTTLLPGYILSAQGDRMLMAHSVEGRFPFLDADLVDLANSLPARHKLLGLDEKHILKRVFADLVPESILKRPKQPYRAPDASSFFSGPSINWVNEITDAVALRDACIFEPALIERLIEKCTRMRGQGMSNTDNMRILAVLSTMLTHHLFIASDGRGSHDEEPPQPMMMIDMLGPDSRKGALS